MQKIPKFFFIGYKVAMVALIALLVSACSSTRYLMPTPHIYDGNKSAGFETLSLALQTSNIDLLYVTDRKPETNKEKTFTYGYKRSLSMAFGSVTVIPGLAMNWDHLVAISQTSKRARKIELNIGKLVEQGRYPDTPYPLLRSEEGLVREDPESVVLFDAVNGHFQTELNRRLVIAPKKEVFIYIHGYNNPFSVAAYTLAELWHFSGRETVPILYTWPAGRGGASGYGYDRESGEFTIFHLKQFLQSLATNPKIEKVHILAHSRGTDVITSALRELFIEARALGKDPRSLYRIANLILAAPDLDVEVVSQRIIAERLGLDIDNITIYTSSQDKAIRLSGLLFNSISRVGSLVTNDQNKESKFFRLMAKQIMLSNNISLIETQGKSDFYGHGYFHKNPAVSSDLIMQLRYGAAPGREYGRPIKPAGTNSWIITDDVYKKTE